jgi:predicted nucleic acid-binding protein
MAWVLADEGSAATDELLEALEADGSAAAPALWRWEVANVLVIVERRGRATSGEVTAHLDSLSSLPIHMDELCSAEAWKGAFMLAQKHSLTSYDAAYLELAVRRQLPLATLDVELRRAAVSENVKVLPETI